MNSKVSDEFMAIWNDSRFHSVRENFDVKDVLEIAKSSLETLLWSDGFPLRYLFRIERGDRLKIAENVFTFLAGIAPGDVASVKQIGNDQLGHDLTLTRNGEGSGFWSRESGELGLRLSSLAKSIPPASIQEDEDGPGLHIVIM